MTAGPLDDECGKLPATASESTVQVAADCLACAAPLHVTLAVPASVDIEI